MKPCCSLLTSLSPREAREEILALSTEEVPGPWVLPDSGDKLTLVWVPGGPGKPLLGPPRWGLDIHRSDLGTVVDFRWHFPWKRFIGLSVTALVPGILVATLLSTSGLGVPFLILGLIFSLLAGLGHRRTRRGLIWKNLRALVQEQIGGM